MEPITLLFDKEFVFFLPSIGPGMPILHPCTGTSTIKDIIESKGIPHTEIGKIVTGNAEKNFSHIPDPGETVIVSSVKPPLDVTKPTILRPDPYDTIKFVADVNVGKLARFMLRMGFNTKFSNSFTDDQVADIASNEKRVVLTRDTGLLKRKKICFSRRIRSSDPYLQLREVLTFFGLDKGPFDFLSRCSFCNKKLVPVDKKLILHRLEPKTKLYYTIFKICPSCSRIFWKGSHHDDMKKRFKALGIFFDP